jgi:hypothetical protein
MDFTSHLNSGYTATPLELQLSRFPLQWGST